MTPHPRTDPDANPDPALDPHARPSGPSRKRFTGRVVIVTGAAQGIGLAVAQAFAQEGAIVAMLDVNAVELDLQATSLAAAGLQVWPLAVDVRDADAVTQAVDEVIARHGQVDVLANVAGVLHAEPVLRTSAHAWAHTFDVNVRGVFHLCQAVTPHMMARGQGCVVTVGSNAATTPRVDMAAYAASKAASAQFTRCLGLELARHGVRCNIVSPGSTDTPMQQALWSDPASGLNRVLEGDPARYRLGIPLQRLAQPQDVAQAVCFLASDEARHITLHDLRVDGGATLDA